jgi:hypothetical protein
MCRAGADEGARVSSSAGASASSSAGVRVCSSAGGSAEAGIHYMHNAQCACTCKCMRSGRRWQM